MPSTFKFDFTASRDLTDDERKTMRAALVRTSETTLIDEGPSPVTITGGQVQK
jgi:hypothetical protein